MLLSSGDAVSPSGRCVAQEGRVLSVSCFRTSRNVDLCTALAGRPNCNHLKRARSAQVDSDAAAAGPRWLIARSHARKVFRVWCLSVSDSAPRYSVKSSEVKCLVFLTWSFFDIVRYVIRQLAPLCMLLQTVHRWVGQVLLLEPLWPQLACL